MRIHWRIGLLPIFFGLFSGNEIYYHEKSLLLTIVNKVLFIERFILLRRLSVGVLKRIGNIRTNAMINAFSFIDKAKVEPAFCKKLSKLFLIDFEVTLNRYIFEKKYYEYEHLSILNELRSNDHIDNLNFEKSNWTIIKTILTITFLLPQFLYIYLFFRYKIKKSQVSNKIICNISDISTYEMFSNIFSGCDNVLYCSEAMNIFKPNGSFIQQGFPSERFYDWLIKSFRYSYICITHLNYIKSVDLSILGLFKSIFKGYSLAVSGQNNLFITFEHLTQDRGIRNQFLKVDNNVSVFLSKNSYVTFQQYPSEAFINYDVIICSGRHLEEMLRNKRSLTDNFFLVGSYDSAVGVSRIGNQKTKIAAAHKKIRITFLATGVCDETYECELYLVELAKALSKCTSYEVSFRMKPVQLIPKYEFFYQSISHDNNINMLAWDSNLFDSIKNTDIYISSLSTSAFDLSAAGARVLFINNTHPHDTYIPWLKFPQILLSGCDLSNEKNIEIIKNRIYSALHDKNYYDFMDYVGYKIKNLNDYIKDVRNSLEPFTTALKIKTKEFI